MNKQNTQSILKFSLLIAIAITSGCGQSTLADSSISNSQLTQVPTTITILTPTARAFEQASNCNSSSDSGHIFFFRGNSEGKRNHASYYDLYVMDGNGCFARFVMPEVSGSPAWSIDNKQLAVGCENNSYLCILDIDATLDTCEGLENEIGGCHPVILRKIDLPSKVAGDERMYNIAWSSDDSQVAVEGGSPTTPQRWVYVLSLTDNGTWNILLQGLGSFDIAWSPKDDQLVLSGLTFINLKSDNIEGSNGFNPEWSPDGEKIAFVANSRDETKEPYGIASINLNSGNWQWLYEPKLRDQYYYPPHDLVISDDGRYHRLLSWSPDQSYIAFVSEVGLGAQSHIFRLNIETGEIINLTANLDTQPSAQAYYAPAWGQ